MPPSGCMRPYSCIANMLVSVIPLPLQPWPRQSLHQPGGPGQTHHGDGPGSPGHVCQRAQEDHSPSTFGLWKHWNRFGLSALRVYVTCAGFNPICAAAASAGGVIPPDTVLVYDVLLLDIWNTEDQVQIRTLGKPAGCNRTAAPSDFVRYHYNGTLLSGERFDSRWSCIITRYGLMKASLISFYASHDLQTMLIQSLEECNLWHLPGAGTPHQRLGRGSSGHVCRGATDPYRSAIPGVRRERPGYEILLNMALS